MKRAIQNLISIQNKVKAANLDSKTILFDVIRYWSPNNCLSRLPPQCPGKDKCPLGIAHPPNGFEEYLLGCSMCKLEEATGEAMVISEAEKEEENWLDW